ncbi:hypothetical protein EMPS_02713 [Entomortierella parvispora]|uniref:Sulfate transporter n=1 Tax=Entomortierella parvispora TaxID=205924 RepID=A0A9P3H588_9FUNG|nr:hypothetical protein EMPS_02713 [Entomortierella parvispora]
MAEVLPTNHRSENRHQGYGSMIKGNVEERLTSFRSGLTLGEMSGSLGDLGTLLPILLSLALTGQIDLTASLIFGGVWNIVTGIMFRMPMCVQPMKSIAAIALTNQMSRGAVMGAGISVSMVIFFLGATRTIHLVKKFTPMSVIRGIQLGTAISFAGKAAALVKQANTFGGEGWDWANNYEWACASFIIVFLFYYRSKRVPTAMILFFIGLIIAFIKLYTNPPNGANYPKIGIYTISTIVPTVEEFKHGFLSAGLGQIPLTALNSVIALAALANDLFPELPAGTPHISMSIGVMNLVGCFFGSMPFCHGSGGLAAQYRFGARTEVSIIVLGSLKIFFGLFFGSSLMGLIQSFPSSILGIMLFISGVELGAAARSVNDGVVDDQKRHANFIVMTVTAGMLVGFSNDGIGFLGGMVTALSFYIGSRIGGTMDNDNTGILPEGLPLRENVLQADSTAALTTVPCESNDEQQEGGSTHKMVFGERESASSHQSV